MVATIFVFFALLVFFGLAFSERTFLDCSDYVGACVDDLFTSSLDISFSEVRV